MLASYVWRDLVRNQRRTLTAAVGVMLGVGLFSGVLFFIDGSGASMTQRAIAPLALDIQRVVAGPTGGGLSLAERASHHGPLAAGQTVQLSLTVSNRGAVPANEVVVNDEPLAPLRYIRGSATLDGRALPDKAGQIPLAQGLARSGLNLGTVAPGRTVRLTYSARATGAAGSVPLQATISTRENVVPTHANLQSRLTPDRLATSVRKIPGVSAADGLAFVDLPPGALSAGATRISDTVRVFAFDHSYVRHYPSIRIVSGGLRPGAAALSAEAARALSTKPGAAIQLRLPGARTPLRLPVGAVTDLSRARPLFYSRKSSDLEAFLYRANSVVVDPATFMHTIVPAFANAAATRGATVKSLPLLELDVLVKRSRLHADPGTALAQTTAISRSIARIAPGQDYQLDNISNTLQVARDDASVAKRMFLFLGLPGALLAAFLAAFAGGVLASAQRRETANLRIRGADRNDLMRMLVYRTLALAGAGSIAGTALGLVCVMAILGRSTLFAAAVGRLILSALLGVGVGMICTAVALYLPGRRSLRREISHERGELAPSSAPAWRRLRLDFVLLAATAAGAWFALRGHAFDAPAGSVYEGRAVSLPSYLLVIPIGAWIGGVLLSVRAFDAFASRVPVPAAPRFGALVYGSLARSVRRRSWSLAGGIAAVGLIVAFGTSLAIFAATYDHAKAADARVVVGSDLRVTPSVLSPRSHPAAFARKLGVGGVSAATPVVFKEQNSVLTSAFNEDQSSLAAIDPAGFARVAALSDSFFDGRTAKQALAALQAHPNGVLVDAKSADDLKITVGDKVHVLFARATKQQQRVPLRVVGIFKHFPGFPQGVHLVANLSTYASATHLDNADFFLARSADSSPDGVARAAAALRSGPGRGDPIAIQTSRTSLDKDQSSLTALNVNGLLSLDSLFTLLMGAAAISIFVFGLMLQRRREYVTMRALGLRTSELRALVLGETAVVAICGLVSGIAVGTAMGFLLVHILRPLFVLDPGVTLSLIATATLVGLVLAATLASALAATALLRRLRPTELLREA